jgi:hypothetical protein
VQDELLKVALKNGALLVVEKPRGFATAETSMYFGITETYIGRYASYCPR